MNPGSHSLLLNRDMLARLSGKLNIVTVEKETQVFLGEPAEYPHELVEAIKKTLKTMREVKRAWFMLMMKDQVQRFLIVLDFSGERENIFRCRQSCWSISNQANMDMVLANDNIGKSAIQDRTPFYKRSFFW